MIDLPHDIQRMLALFAGTHLELASGEERRDGISAVYAFGASAEYDGFVLEGATVCSPPLWFEVNGHRFTPNSGAHRVLLRGRYRGEPMLLAIEEREDRGCEYQGEILHVGVRSTREGQDDPGILAALIRGAIAAATGNVVDIPITRQVAAVNARGRERGMRDRFEVVVRPYEELEAEACSLTPAAKSCLLFALPEAYSLRVLPHTLLRNLLPASMLLM